MACRSDSITGIAYSKGFTLLSLPTLGGDADAVDLNQNGDVAGWAAENRVRHAVVWSKGTLQRLPDSDSSQAFALNDHGTVVGVMQDPRLKRSCMRAVIWENGGAPRLLPAYPSSSIPDTSFSCVRALSPDCSGFNPRDSTTPVRVNNNGTILTRGFLVTGSSVRGVPPGYPCAWALNNRDQAVVTIGDEIVRGYNDRLVGLGIAVNGNYFFVNPCYMRAYTYVAGVNDQSVVAGTTNTCDTRAFLVGADGTVTDLSPMTGSAWAAALNNKGDVLLGGATPSGTGIFVLSQGTLSSVEITEPGWSKVPHASAINDAGVILGWATDPQGARRSVLLSPKP